MEDYKEMYLTMMRASESAIQTLIAAQQKCEELYLQKTEEHPETDIPSSCDHKEY